MTPTKHQGERFGQRPPPLTTYLHSLIRDYPKGIGIIKEFVQNADDAGATCMKIIVDWRSHPIASLPSPTMAELMGPALLFYNDARFTNDDLEGIKQLSQGSKAADTGKTGRFGLGFNSAYNVTDVPCFVTGDHIYFFDPHGNTVSGANTHDPGRSWPLKVLWDEAPNLLAPFSALGLKHKQAFYPHTVFRLPFRTREQALESEISKEPFNGSDVEAIFEALEGEGAELLLFLRHLTGIEVFEITERAPILRLRYKFRTRNEAEVKGRRDRLRQWQDQGDVLPLIKSNRKLSVTYRHNIEITTGETKREEVWRVVNGLYCDPDGELVAEAIALNNSGEKVFPNAGAAALIGGRKDEVPPGSAYCFLPLPIETRLPVHIHGFFDLDRSRRNLTDVEGLVGHGARRGRWNRLLVEHAVTAAYAELLVQLRKDIGDRDPAGFYRHWPLDDAPVPFARLLPSLVDHLDKEQIISTVASGRWRTFEESVTLEAEWARLKEPLAAMGLAVADPPLPPKLKRALRDAGAFLEELTPKRLTRELRLDYDLDCLLIEVEQPWLRERAWLEDLLKFCLRDPDANLSDLPLALMADGKLRTFGQVRASNGSPVDIYLGGRTERSLFLSYAFLFIDPDFAEEAGLREISHAHLKRMTPALVVRCLNWILGEPGLKQPKAFRPESEKPPNSVWLKELYEYLTAHKDEWWDETMETREIFRQLALVPDQFDALRRSGYDDTPLLLRDVASPLGEALNYLDVPIISAEASLKRVISRFADTFGEFIYRLTPTNLVDTLNSLDFLGDQFDAEIHGPILDFFSTTQAIKELSEERKQAKLAELKIFAVSDDKLVRLNESNTFLSVTRDLPPDLQGAHFLKEGPDSRWRGLFRSLGAEELTEARIADLILENYPMLNETAKKNSLTWLRDNLSAAERAADDQVPNGAQALRERLSQAPLVRCDDSLYRAAIETYTPEVELPRKVLGSSAHLPDMDCYAETKDRWLEFFGQLGMASSPRPEDLITYLDLLLSQAEREGVRAVETTITQFAAHVSRNWTELEQKSEVFAALLAERAWLPSLQQPKRDLPGFVAPADQLYQPAEIYASTSELLVASQVPVLGFTLSSEIRTALEIPNRPDIELVLRHFNHLLKLWHSPDHSALEAKSFGASIEAIYRFLGSFDAASLAPILEAYAAEPCLWDPKTERLWLPQHVFGPGVKTHVFGSRRVQLSSENKPLDDGYKALGRRNETEHSDYLEFLLEIMIECEGKKLSADDQKVVLTVLDYLRLEADPKELKDVAVLTRGGTLALAEETYLDDAHWFADRLDAGAVNLIHRAIDGKFALSIGVSSLSKSVQEKLDSLVRSEQTDTQQQCQKWQRIVRSPEFSQGVRRLVEHEGAEVRDGDLKLFTRIVVVPAKVIRTTLWLESERRKIGEGETASIFDEDRDEVCLSEPLIAKFLADELNKTLEDARLNDTSTLSAMLNASPDDLAALLDRCKISRLKGDIAEQQTTSDELWEGGGAEKGDWQVGDLPEGDASETPLQADPVSEAVGERPKAPQQYVTNTQRLEPDKRAAALPSEDNPTVNELLEGTAVHSASPNGAPRQRRSSEENASRSRSARRANQQRHHTFVYAEHKIVIEDDDKDEGHSERAQRIGRAAELTVMNHEHEEGRMPILYGGNNEGFDIISTSADGSKRYIEVKGIDGPWGERGVAMSVPQYEKALGEGSNYWLYVVEYALDDEAALITAVKNPTGSVKRYVFDAGWKNIG